MNKCDLKIILIAASLLLMPNLSAAVGLSFSDNQVFSHGYINFRQTGPLYFTDYPFSRSGKRLVFQTSYRQLYDIRELTDNRAALALSLNSVDFGAAAAVFGKADYFQQMGISIFANYTRQAFTLGISAVYSNLSFNDNYDDISWSGVNTGIAYLKNDWLFFAAGRNLNRPRYYSGSDKLPIQLEVGTSYYSQSGLENQVKTLFTSDQKPSAELSQSFVFTDYASLDWSLVLRPVRIGAGVVLRKGYFEFDYNFSHHPVLGGTHTINLSICTTGKK